MMMRGNAVFMLVIILPLLGHNIVAGGSRRRRQGHVLLKSILYSRKLNKPVLSLDDEKTPTTAFDPSPKLLPQRWLKEKDRIKKLPGQPGWVNFAQYGGYVTVDEKAGRALFYYFVEALGPNPSSKPLLLWFNGGPGCSSLGYGVFEELGPFRVKSDGRTLFRNPYAWNAVANVLFLESPAGTGFSYSNTTSDYERSGDRRSAEDALVFLLNWLERFPEYKGSDFYIAGESYAGHFVPQLAQSVYQNNQSPHNGFINLNGLLMGNAVINHDTDFKGMYDYLWTHALISDESIDGIHKFCDFSLPDLGEGRSPRCKKAFSESDEIFGQQIDIYHIYAPVCASENITAVPRRASIQDFDPCTDYYVEAYLNRPEVQDALHANVTKLDYSWVGCSDKVDDWNDMPRTVLPLIWQLMEHGIRVWIYSGDVDGVIPVTASRYSINMLRLPVKSPWRPWSVRGEVCGYTVVYGGNLTFATVRGAGHEVPSYQPLRILVLVKSFLNEKPLPR